MIVAAIECGRLSFGTLLTGSADSTKRGEQQLLAGRYDDGAR
jgi:hypothetical protein